MKKKIEWETKGLHLKKTKNHNRTIRQITLSARNEKKNATAKQTTNQITIK